MDLYGGKVFSEQELFKGVSECKTKIEIGTRVVKSNPITINSVVAMIAYSDAVAVAAAPSVTAESVTLRLLDGMRRIAVRDAIKHHLTTRMNERIASGNLLDGDRPRLVLGHLSNSIEFARLNERKAFSTIMRKEIKND